MAELVARSATGAATVRYYLTVGLLPPPVRVAPNRFLYDERHAEALRVIRLLRERRGMSLPAIRDVLPDILASGEQPAFRDEMWDSVVAVAAAGDEEQREVHDRLLASARAAFAARGYAGVNVEQLCHQAGIAKGSFYRHFDSKDAVYAAAARSAAAVVEASVGRWRRTMTAPEAVGAVAAAVEPLMPLLLEVVVRAAHGDTAVARIVPDVVADIADLVDRYLEHGTAQAGGDRDGRAVAEAAFDLLTRRVMGLAVDGPSAPPTTGPAPEPAEGI